MSDKAKTAKEQCLARWPSLRLTCRVQRGRYRITSGPLLIASGNTAQAAWSKALTELDREAAEAFMDRCRTGWQKTLEQFGHGIQSASEGAQP